MSSAQANKLVWEPAEQALGKASPEPTEAEMIAMLQQEFRQDMEYQSCLVTAPLRSSPAGGTGALFIDLIDHIDHIDIH